MKKDYALLSFLLTTLFLASCSTPSYYIPAAAGNDVSYLPKPMGSDSIKVKNYISASVAGLEFPYGTGSADLGFLNFSRGHTFKNINIAYGGYGFAGQARFGQAYNETNPAPKIDDKGIFGGGLRTSIGYYDNAGNAEFRILSWENALSFEGGNYVDLRQKMRNLNDPNIISSTKSTLYTTGIASEIIWHTRRNYNNQFAIRLFYGITPGLNGSLKTSTNTSNGGSFSSTFYFKLNKFYGILDVGGSKGATGKLSLGYSF